jgi:hypothetical protein
MLLARRGYELKDIGAPFAVTTSFSAMRAGSA